MIKLNPFTGKFDLVGSSSGSVSWGAIGGTLTDQTDLQTALDSKQPLSSNLTEYAAVDPTAAGLALLDDASASAQLTTLGSPHWDIDTDSVNSVERLRHSTNNFLGNASFEHWNSGTSSAPDGWTLAGDATISRSSSPSTGSYAAQIVFGTGNTGELYQAVDCHSVVDYTFSCYVERTAGSGAARLVAQRADSPFTEYASYTLPTGAGKHLAQLTVKPSVDGQMRFAIKSGDTTASTWVVDECMFQESKGIATTFQHQMIDDSSSQSIYGNKFFGFISRYSSTLTTVDQLTASPASDTLSSGHTAQFTANENQGFGDAVYIDSDGEAHLGDADAESTSRIIGLCIGSVTTGNTGTYLLPGGFARNDAWNWTVGGFIYLSTTGTTTNTLTQTAPSGTDDAIVVVGVATHADRMFFNPQLIIVEHT